MCCNLRLRFAKNLTRPLCYYMHCCISHCHLNWKNKTKALIHILKLSFIFVVCSILILFAFYIPTIFSFSVIATPCLLELESEHTAGKCPVSMS